MEIARQDNESRLDHHKRIVYGKLVDKTLSDVDYAELSEVVYGQQLSSDVARRMFYGSKRTLDSYRGKKAHRSARFAARSVIENSKRKELRSRKELRGCRIRDGNINKGITSDARFEHLCDIVKGSIEDMKNMDALIDIHPNPDADFSDSEAVLVLSDWHYGMVTDNAFNTYNTEICKERVATVVRKASDRIALHRCKKLHVVVTGDLIHGNCHVSARVASEEVAADQLMQASEILAQAIYSLSRCVEETYVYVTYGNHARSVQNKNDSIHRDNMERIIPWWLEWRMKNYDNIIIVPEEKTEFLFVNACGHDICAAHGDLDTVRTSPKVLTMLFNKRYGKDIEYIILGDKHHRESFEELNVTASICGSLCGADDYANEKRLYSQPSQQLFIVTPEEGVDAEYRIRC